MKTGNLYRQIPENLPEELVEILAEGNGQIKIERIVSRNHSTPDDTWYDQESCEWVVLLTGWAILRFEEPDRTVKMVPGDWLKISAHVKHRVEETSSGDTVWLAVHWTDCTEHEH
ncbi:MAG: hypothetical protein P1V20_23560 [Verrucomicrobiales bacterium]|nr:hypothetical protein [Verrucomicrobiales bacterium]